MSEGYVPMVTREEFEELRGRVAMLEGGVSPLGQESWTRADIPAPQDPCPSLTAMLAAAVAAIPEAAKVALEQRTAEHWAQFQASFGTDVCEGDRHRACSLALGELASHPDIVDAHGVERPVSGVSIPKTVPLAFVTERIGGLAVVLSGYLGNWRTYSRPVQGGSTIDYLPQWLRHPPHREG